jgi:hypothetical protein
VAAARAERGLVSLEWYCGCTVATGGNGESLFATLEGGRGTLLTSTGRVRLPFDVGGSLDSKTDGTKAEAGCGETGGRALTGKGRWVVW